MFQRKSKADKAKDVAATRTRQAGEAALEFRDRAASGAQASALSVQEAVGALGHSLKDKYGPQAEAAAAVAAERAAKVRDRAVARLDHGVDVAAPKAERAVAAVGPKVDHARDVIVDDVLPKLQELLAGVQSAKDDLLAKQEGAVAQVTGAPKKKKRKGRVLLALGLLTAVGSGVAYYLNKSQAPANDPWATPTEPVGPVAGGPHLSAVGTPPAVARDEAEVPGENTADSTGLTAAEESVEKAGENLEKAATKAGGAVKDSATAAKKKTAAKAEDAKDAVEEGAEKAKEAAKDAADKASPKGDKS